VKWKKLRLTAQLKAAVEQLDQTVLAFEEASLRIEESEWPDTRARENITNSFRLFVADGRVPEELAPKDWSRFVDNIFRLISGSKWSNRKQPDEIAAAIVGSVETECDFLGKGNVPVSISLWQFVFGSLCKSNILEPPLRKCWPVITPELELLYPAVKQFAERFDYSR
jgi:hypothetical protein